MATKTELIQRWDTFLSKIEARYNESLQQAEDACVEQLIDTDYDYYTVYRSWMGMKAQIDQLLTKISDTWYNKVQPQMEAVATTGDSFHLDESFKYSALNDKLVKQMMRFQTELEGKLSQQFYDHAIEVSNQNFNCTQCGAALQVKKDLFRAQYITCGACNTVNTFEPETKFVQIGWNVVDNIVALQCLPLQDKLDDAAEALTADRNNQHTDAQWTNYKNAYFTYWETYFKERIKLKSNAAERYDEDMQRKTLEYQEYENTRRHNKYGIK